MVLPEDACFAIFPDECRCCCCPQEQSLASVWQIPTLQMDWMIFRNDRSSENLAASLLPLRAVVCSSKLSRNFPRIANMCLITMIDNCLPESIRECWRSCGPFGLLAKFRYVVLSAFMDHRQSSWLNITGSLDDPLSRAVGIWREFSMYGVSMSLHFSDFDVLLQFHNGQIGGCYDWIQRIPV